MVQHEEMLTCLKCGYALRGLPAHKCGDCGHVYLRCPECGASQVANEAQNRLLLQMRVKAARLPGMVQAAQMGFLVVLGVSWVIAGFFGGVSAGPMTVNDMLVFAAVAAFSASLVRLLVWQWRFGVLTAAAAMGFVVATFAVGMVFASGTSNTVARAMLILALFVLTGACLGAVGAAVTGWLLLWLFAKDADRVLLTEGFCGAIGGRVLAEGPTATRHLMFCTHCAAELPALLPGSCSDCGLQQVTCPACGKRCGVSGALAAMMSLGKITRSVSAGGWVAGRMIAALLFWVALLGLAGESLLSYRSPLAGPVAGFIWYPSDLLTMTWLMLVVAVLAWFVFVRGAGAVAMLNAAMVFTAGWFMLRNRGYAGAQGIDVRRETALLVMAVEAAGASLVASLLAVFVKAALPRRRVAMLEDVVPELAREADGA